MYTFRGVLCVLACYALTTSVRARFECQKGKVGTSYDCQKDDPYESGCEYNVEYTVRCDDTCEKQGKKIWGTTNYTYDSSLCRSALHDRRISSWDPNQRIVRFKRIHYDFGKYHNTINQGIETIRYRELKWNNGYFYFTSPRIKEPLVDFTSLHRKFLYEQHEKSAQECHLPNNAQGRSVQFSFRIPPNDSIPMPQQPQHLWTNTNEYYRMIWGAELKGDIRNYLPGAVQCRILQNDLSTITSMTMRRDYTFAPRTLTLTVNFGDKVELDMFGRNNTPCTPKIGTVWRKDAKMLDTFQDFELTSGVVHQLKYQFVTLGHAGVYSLECKQYNGKTDGIRYDKRGVLRLIVRSCPVNLYGDHCNISCPSCQNGGICHDLLGVCICPPGFTGSLCEIGCGPNTFGRNCDKNCSDTNVDMSATCMGILFCLPDPYGCSCATGFNGLDCQSACKEGYFGAGCTQKRDCHCVNKKSCDIFTGMCPEGCEEGWKDKACITSYPYLSDKPELLKSNPTSLEVSFKAWNTMNGQGTPATYIVEIKDYNAPGSFAEVKRLDASNVTFPDNKTVSIEKLQPNTEYAVRVVIVDIDSNVQTLKAPVDIFRTACGRPTQPLHSLSVILINSTAVKLSWERPGPETWRCSNVTIHISFNSSYRTFEVNVTQDDYYILKSKPFTTWNVRARIVTDNSKKSDWAVFETFITEQDAPSEPKMVKAYFDSQSNNIFVNWTKPVDENGVLHSYNVELVHLNFNGNCNFRPEVVKLSVRSDVTSVVFNSSQFYYYSRYSAIVSAVTVREGPQFEKSVETPESIPEAAPKNIQVKHIEKDNCIVEWKNPKCQQCNGFISKFNFTYEGLDEWEDKIVSMETGITSSMLSGLTPFTNYRFRVSACTAMGCSDLYQEIFLKTLSTNPPMPRELTIFSQTTSSVSLTWKAPYPPYGRIIQYKINYQINQQTSSNQYNILSLEEVACAGSELRANQSCYTINKLKAQTKYDISVTAINDEFHESDQSDHVTALTAESIPDAPESIQMGNRTTSSIFVSWLEPMRANGELVSYRINVTLVNLYGLNPIDGNTILTEVLEKQQTAYNITELAPASTYNVSVQAATKVGYGPAVMGSFITKNEIPKVTVKPEVGRITRDSVELIIKPLTGYNGPISAYYVLVKDVTPGKRRRRAAVEMHTYNQSQIEYMAAKLRADTVPPEGLNFTVGDGRDYDGFYNGPLQNGHSYIFGTAVESELDGEKQLGFLYLNEVVVVRERSKISHQMGIIIGTILAVILVFGIFFLILYYKKPELFYAIKGKGGNSFLMKNTKSGLVKEATGSTLSMGDEPTYDDCLVRNSVRTNLIRVEDLEAYAQEANISPNISQEYLSVGKGIIHPCHLGKLADNKSKNRYGNLLPYDHSRVKLEKDDSGDYSDYINANYIENFKGESTFIATQGPKPLTVPDFWRMVWQENTCKVVMVTNVIEGGRIKCEKYWPDTVEKYGKFTINLIETETFADFVIRTLMVTKGESQREIKQFHFTTWPDHGIPAYPVAVTTFLKRIRNYNSESTAPVVVHCSAGVGRTGTIILLANMIAMAKETNTVDVLNGLWAMRQCRVNMVETLEQYIFVYNALSDYLCAGETSLLCPEFRKQLNEIIESKDGPLSAQLQFERLQRLCPNPKFTDCVVAHDPENGQKNRVADILPPDRSRAILPVNDTDGNDYINAVYINGYKQNNVFIATQLPLPDTVKDFWRLVLSTKISSIVLLHEFNQNDSTCPQYWEEGSTQIYGDITVQHVSTEEQGTTLRVRTFSIKGHDLNSEEITVKQFHLQGWMSNNDTPDIPDSILDLIDKAERWQKQTSAKTLLVQCLNGATGCGIFCASVFMRDKIKTEQEVDVYLAVRNVRANRPQFITNLNQYIFLHKVAIMYLDSFETYANFQ